MHLPDGFLATPVWVGADVVGAAGLAIGLKRLEARQEPDLIPRMGLTGAFIFAAQMVNFPVAPGVSGHLLGGALAAILLGPTAATVTMAVVFLAQTFFFQDGGVTALGANFVNMGLAGTLGGYAIYRALAGRDPGRLRRLIAAGAGAVGAVLLGALLTGVMLAVSGHGVVVVPVLLATHVVIGLGEAAITVATLSVLMAARPGLLAGANEGNAGRRFGWTMAALIGVAALLAPLASSFPDGLESVAERLGFAGRAAEALVPAPMPDYTLPGAPDTWGSPLLISLAGGLITLALIVGWSRWLRMKQDAVSALWIDPRARLFGALCLIVAAALLPWHAVGRLGLLLALAAALAAIGAVRLRWLATRAALLLPFVGLMAVSAVAARAQGGASVAFFGVILAKAGVSLLSLAAFLAATSETEALAALRALRVPRILVEMLSFQMRYLRVLTAEASRMLRARAARIGVRSSWRRRLSGTGGVIAALFSRAYERSERLSLAMAARGFTGSLPETPRPALRPVDYLFGVALLAVALWVSLGA